MESFVGKTPERLCTLSIKTCLRYPLKSLTEFTEREYVNDDGLNKCLTDEVNVTEQHARYRMRNDVYLYNMICEPLFDGIANKYPEHYLKLFTDTSNCQLTKLNLSSAVTIRPILDQQIFIELFHHPLREINLSGCQVQSKTLLALQHCAATLKCLHLANVAELKNNFIFNQLKNLEKLNLQNSDLSFHSQHMRHIGSLPNLTWLDISLTLVDDRSLKRLRHCGNTLKWLCLHQCAQLVDEMGLISLFTRLENLVHLDISRISNEETDESTTNNSSIVTGTMLKTFAQMANLRSLDISGAVNLKQEDLEPFGKRYPKLKFLGLCQTGLSYHSKLPAEIITGEANEEQILMSLKVYANRSKYISFALRHLFSLACHHNCHQIDRCAKLIIKAMNNFKDNSGIHVAAMAILYHVSRMGSRNLDINLRRDMILAILDSMENLKGVLQLQKNACLTLCNFKIPRDVEFVYYRVADLLLETLRNHQDDYLRGITIMLFNAIVCQNAGHQKKEVGLRGAIQTVMQVIREKVDRRETDSLLDTCWSSLWNITDETPENCQDFLNNGGMQLFVDCLSYFPNSLELHRNMMGLMGNVAEVHMLRPYLMNEEYIQLFLSLLNNDPLWLEVSYNSVGLLSHILSDGPEAWTIKRISRDECMSTLICCIDNWDIRSTRNINYRSFKPILGLLNCFHAPSAQHWAVWALANLTTVSPGKYCKLVVLEDGIEMLKKVRDADNVIPSTKSLAQTVIVNCLRESGT